MTYRAGIKGRLGIKGQLQYRRADGSIIKTVDLVGSIPLDDQHVAVLKPPGAEKDRVGTEPNLQHLGTSHGADYRDNL